MKKRICLLIFLVLISSVTIGGVCSCSSARSGQYQPLGVNDVLEQGMAAADNNKADDTGLPAENSTQDQQIIYTPDDMTPEPSPEPSPEPDTDPIPSGDADDTDGAEGVDVDLTKLSKTMVYSEVYNMMYYPENYIGKTVRMRGQFNLYPDESTGNIYFACIIQDATACCAQGIEFELTDDYVYPDDYPEPDEEICVVGVFDTYKEGDYTYCTLRNAKLM